MIRLMKWGIQLAGTVFLCVESGTGFGASLEGYGELSGRVVGTAPNALAVVFANNTDLDVAYTVFVIDGEYRANNLLPGDYEVTVRPALGQLEKFAPVISQVSISADRTTKLDVEIGAIERRPDYVGGVDYPDAEIAPYDEVYPPGPGRDILERTCHGCHSVQFYPYNVDRAYSGGRAPKDRQAWAATVDRMHKTPAFNRRAKASMFDPALLPPADRDTLVDYLATNFPADASPRVVQLEKEPVLDREALRKAQFVEYNYHEPAGKYDVWPWPHQVDFDADGNVWLAYTACCIVRFDPRTGEQTVFEDHGGGHGIAVDQTDGTVWYSGDVVRRLDPESGRVDHWKLGEDRYLGSNTQIFDSKGNLWLSLLAAGGLGKWDRRQDTIIWWEVPVLRSRPYGIIVDHSDNVWWADYHNGGVTRFDQRTEEFRHFRLVEEGQASAIRRLGVDSRNHIWAGTWGNRAFNDAALYELDPQTGKVIKREVGIDYGAVYNAEADPDDRIWIAPDNYVSVFDPQSEQFTHYPMPVRSDSLKTTIARNGGVWFMYRNAGKYEGYGGTAVVLYPDKDAVTELGAYHWKGSPGNHLDAGNAPPAPPVKGGDRIVENAHPVNFESYMAWAMEQGLAGAAEALAGKDADAGQASTDAELVAAGKRAYAACVACHTMDAGGASGLGPNLHGVFGQPAARSTAFAYSQAMKSSELIWSAENLDRFLAAPADVVPGTTMNFIGVTSAADRRAIVAYLKAIAFDAKMKGEEGESTATRE